MFLLRSRPTHQGYRWQLDPSLKAILAYGRFRIEPKKKQVHPIPHTVLWGACLASWWSLSLDIVVVIAIVYAVNTESRPFPAWLRDKLTASKLHADPQRFPCGRIFAFELRIIKGFDMPLQVGCIDILDRII